jgi:hypothetical protein
MEFQQNTAPAVLMVKPYRFGYNEQTAVTNQFQEVSEKTEGQLIHEQAMAEFDQFAGVLKAHGVEVLVAHDSPEPPKPDAIFPNNWITMHPEGTAIFYPMCTPNRRWERRRAIVDLLNKYYKIDKEIDLSHYEEDEKYLEGTGSMVFDRANKVCYACISARTNQEILELFCQKTGHELVSFYAHDPQGQAIYHTNVMMSVAEHYAIVCLESIHNPAEKERVVHALESHGKTIIPISYAQMYDFAGNVLELRGKDGLVLAMSERAYHAFTEEQRSIISKYATPVYAPLTTIEKVGGGGARCMLAEIFLPKRT